MSVSIPKDVQDFMAGKTGWVATSNRDGMPNATPKGTVKILDDSTVIFTDLFSLKTRKNLQENPKAAVTVIDEESYKGYQIKGTATLIDSGELFEKVKEELKQASMELPSPKYVVKIDVQEVFDQSPGPDAGKQIV